MQQNLSACGLLVWPLVEKVDFVGNWLFLRGKSTTMLLCMCCMKIIFCPFPISKNVMKVWWHTYCFSSSNTMQHTWIFKELEWPFFPRHVEHQNLPELFCPVFSGSIFGWTYCTYIFVKTSCFIEMYVFTSQWRRTGHNSITMYLNSYWT